MVRRVSASGWWVGLSAVLSLAVVGWTVSVSAQGQQITCATGFAPVVVPAGAPAFVPLASLKTAPNPVIPLSATGTATLRADLVPYVADLRSAIQLGKALFWDMQAGSDNKTACATCHFDAGADSRTRNQVHPSADQGWNNQWPNYPFAPDGSDFPADTDNASGSQGVRKSVFKGIGSKGAELVTPVSDPVFSVNGVNTRQATKVNAPSTINAVFNHRNFHNGRAQPEFNGVNPFGPRDGSARVWMLDAKGTPVAVDIHIQNASLASQAVGPPLNATEMSAAGRTFPDLARKLLALKPLGLQHVAWDDSVLGPIADASAGLTVSYTTLIRRAFQPTWWNSKKSVVVNGKTVSMTEANFSMFWGLSIMLYQATLVSDDSPMDQYVATRVFGPNQVLSSHDPRWLDQVVARLESEGISITRDSILRGLDLFERPVAPMVDGRFQLPPPSGTGVGCVFCHLGAETTSASVRNLAGGGLEPGDIALKNAGFDPRMERMFMSVPPVPAGTTSVFYDSSTFGVMTADGTPVRVGVYDSGWYNIGVRPTFEDLGVDDRDPFGNSLSWTRLFQAGPNPGVIRVAGGGLGCSSSPPAAPATSPFAGEVLDPSTGYPLLSGPLSANESSDVAGSFKTPALRNVELTGPYFHNGGHATLAQLIGFYDTGGLFQNETLSPLIRPLGLTPQQAQDLVAFMLALTDERVRWKRAPFDHPQLFVPNGDLFAGTDDMVEVEAVGAGGRLMPLARFLRLSPFGK